MPLNPQVEALLALMAQAPQPDFATMTAAEVRANSDTPMAFGPPPEVAQVRELDLPLEGRTLDARLYLPEGAGERPPLVVFYHGGGWVIGTLDTHDATARALARASGAAVLSVAYRLAPEHRYPAPVEDCFDALCWAARNGDALGVDATRLAVAGDSAGGNLAAAVAILARDRGGPALRHQCLVYPVADRDFTLPSYVENGGGDAFLSTAMMAWFWDQYLGETPAEQATLAAVLRHPDLAGLPPASVFTAEFDPLRDEGLAYARRLADSGVAVESHMAPGMIHGFFSMFQAVPDAQIWIDRAGDSLRAALY
ncbi:MAG: chloramphenicol hydrolase [Pseudomonadota bacterium]